jgi:leader peptidase (prepilin peptidase)/N-methyltransferase
MAFLGAFFLVLTLAFPGGMGMGDCKLAGIVGLYLGWLGWHDVVMGVLLPYLGAATFVVVKRVMRSSINRPDLPFAPFMASGALVAVLLVRLNGQSLRASRPLGQHSGHRSQPI